MINQTFNIGSNLRSFLKDGSLRNEDNIVTYLRLMMMESHIGYFDVEHPENTEPFVKSVFDWDGWINNCANTDHPPDYYNDEQKLMMEVMSISHYQYEDEKGHKHDPDSASTARCIKEMYELDSKMTEDFFQHYSLIKAIGKEDPDRIHSYDQYLASFRRVVGHHIDMIPKYRKNYPGYKLIFLIFDETTPYEIINGVNEQTGDRFYEAQTDEAFISVLREADLDLVIWFCPYMETKEKKLSNLITFFNPHYPIKTYSYSSNQLRCLESEDGKPKVPVFVWWSEDKDGFHRKIIWG